MTRESTGIRRAAILAGAILSLLIVLLVNGGCSGCGAGSDGAGGGATTGAGTSACDPCALGKSRLAACCLR